MKKITILFVVLFGATSMLFAQSQTFTNKNNQVVTPEAGDWVLGFNAVPILNYLGNSFNGNTANTISATFTNTNNALYGKYYLTQNTAFRGSLRLMQTNSTTLNLTDTSTVGVDPAYITDKTKRKSSAVVLGLGLEKRRGKGRVHGYYGAEALITYGTTVPNLSYSYELEMNKDNVANGLVAASRTMSNKSGATFGIGARALIGIEVFILPKISIAAEYGWGLAYQYTANGKMKTENWGLATPTATSASRYEVTSETGGSRAFIVDTDNNTGAITLLFHF